ncbi:peptide chain release factor 1 [Candidatus Margulisiibacteriota bacterium]
MLTNKLQTIEDRYLELETFLSSQDVIADRELFQKLSKEHSDLGEIVGKFREYKTTIKELEELKKMDKEKDKELKKLVEEELKQHEEKEVRLNGELELLLLPKDPTDEKSIFIEIRAGTGGDEAALFAGNLFRMYLRYAENNGYRIEIISENSTGLGGYKEVVFGVYGKGAYSKFKFESGTHRVQRVPKTESGGRIHTSAITVAVMPEAEEIDLTIDTKDLRIDTYRAGGAGGQNVNKVSSAVRITHIPTNTVVACQDERSQHQNRAKAMRLLRTRILAEMQTKQNTEMAEMRKIQVGSGDRSEKIRTYNFPQSRITDHRIGFSVHNLEQVLDGALDEIIEALTTADRVAKLEKSKHVK